MKTMKCVARVKVRCCEKCEISFQKKQVVWGLVKTWCWLRCFQRKHLATNLHVSSRITYDTLTFQNLYGNNEKKKIHRFDVLRYFTRCQNYFYLWLRTQNIFCFEISYCCKSENGNLCFWKTKYTPWLILWPCVK